MSFTCGASAAVCCFCLTATHCACSTRVAGCIDLSSAMLGCERSLKWAERKGITRVLTHEMKAADCWIAVLRIAVA